MAALLLQTGGCPRDRAPAGPDRVRVDRLASEHDLPPAVHEGDTASFRTRDVTMDVTADSRKLTFNGVLIWLNAPVRREGTALSLSTPDVTRVVHPLLHPEKALAGTAPSVVVLDPGHGGSDTGAIGRNRALEKDVVLDIARRTRDRLSRSGVKVKLTRDRDVTVRLSTRSRLAKRWNADLFVSIHVNSAHSRTPSGLETYVMSAPGFPSTAQGSPVDRTVYPGNRYDAASMILAYQVHRELLKRHGFTDRGIRRARFDVICNTPCPAILVECGFISNAAEERRMKTESYRQTMADGIAAGILGYLDKTGSR
jgi:N-acetylmuramoyl-L-alanine amidase